ncbi:hypothetical protein V7147_22730, partial [Bacillus sp. JJ1521]|uniref:hypothetical protein n=1 Tax=Bacillus sp. JJ1521 TaxID=3122957 RepID=UPI003000F76C
MKNYQNDMFMNPNMHGGQPSMSQTPQQGFVTGSEGIQMGYPEATFQQNVGGGHPYPVQQQMIEEDCGCGQDEEETRMATGFNPYGPGMTQNIMVSHGPHGPGCTCGHQQDPMAGAGMMGGFDPQGP